MTDLESEREIGTKRWCKIEGEGWRNQIGRGQKNMIFLSQKLVQRESGRE